MVAELRPDRVAARFLRAGALVIGLALGASGTYTLPLPAFGVRAVPAYPTEQRPLRVAPRPPRDPAIGLTRAAAVAQAAAGHRCVPVADWQAGQIPRGAVMTPHRREPVAATASWVGYDLAWSMATRGQADTVLLCGR